MPLFQSPALDLFVIANSHHVRPGPLIPFQDAAYGLLVGAEGTTAGKAGSFLVWEPKRGHTTLTLVTNEEEIQDNEISRDADGEILMNGEETGHDELLVCIQAFQTMFGFRQMHLEGWGDRPLLVHAIGKVDKKGLKESTKAFKSFRKSVRQADKANKRASRKERRRGSVSRCSHSSASLLDVCPSTHVSTVALITVRIVGRSQTSISEEPVIVEAEYDVEPEVDSRHPALTFVRDGLSPVSAQRNQYVPPHTLDRRLATPCPLSSSPPLLLETSSSFSFVVCETFVRPCAQPECLVVASYA